jgi:NitT/TauT family transport system ATP-binding protein
MAFLEMRDVHKSFQTQRGHTHALANVDLSVEEGEFCAIIGPSGCGKSTLLRLIDGLIRPSSGEILLRGKRVENPGPDRGMVFQHSNLMPWRTVLKNVEFGLECLGMPAKVRRERALEYIDTVGLGGFVDHYPRQLSGGMQQRAGLARAFAIEPAILLMDEPFGALDAQTRVVLQGELERIWLKEGRTAVLVTHDMEEAVYLADRVACMSSRPGRFVEIIDVPFERPRSDELRSDARFAKIKAELWRALRGDAAKEARRSGESE